jgi:hypothetical protein
MTPMDAAALVVLLVLPFDWLIRRELARAENPDPRQCGIVVVRERALDSHSGSVGHYLGHEIWRSVTFRGHVYRFDRIQPAAERERLAPGELFLDPGLVYVLGVPA